MPDHSSSGGTAAPDACPAAEHFDNARLPYRWVPGLEVRRLPETFYHTAPWIEVSHTFDWTPGPLWLYAAPGSGTWWNPGSRVVTRNMVSAVLLWRSPEQVAAAIQAQERDNPDYLHWRLAYGETPWLEVLRRAAAGEPPFDLFAMAGELLAPLLTPPDGVDSVLLLQQMHYWPRWWDEAHDRSRYGYAPRLLLDAARGAGRASTVAARVHRVPEIVDFRVQVRHPSQASRCTPAHHRPSVNGQQQQRQLPETSPRRCPHAATPRPSLSRAWPRRCPHADTPRPSPARAWPRRCPHADTPRLLSCARGRAGRRQAARLLAAAAAARRRVGQDAVRAGPGGRELPRLHAQAARAVRVRLPHALRRRPARQARLRRRERARLLRPVDGQPLLRLRWRRRRRRRWWLRRHPGA